MTTTVTLYTRAGCHLCEEAAASLDALERELPIEVDAVDIDADPALRERFNDIAPAIAVGGAVVTSAPVDFEAIRRAIRQAG